MLSHIYCTEASNQWHLPQSISVSERHAAEGDRRRYVGGSSFTPTGSLSWSQEKCSPLLFAMLLFSSNSPFSPQLMHHHLLYTSLWGGPVAFFRRRPRGEIIGKWWAQYGCLSSNVRIRRLPQVKPYHWPLQSHMNHQQQRDTHRHTHTHFQGRISSGIFLPSHVYSKLRSFLFLFFFWVTRNVEDISGCSLNTLLAGAVWCQETERRKRWGLSGEFLSCVCIYSLC